MVTGLRNADRGQLLLVGSVAIAFVILGTTIMLNGMMYQDTIGSQGNEQALRDALRTKEMVRTDMQRLAPRVREDTGRGSYRDALRENVSQYGRYYANMSFDDGIVFVNVTLNESASREGQYIIQNASSTTGNANFDNSWNSNNPWTVTDDATVLSPFNLTVTEINSHPVHHPKTTLRVENPSSGEFWELRINYSDNSHPGDEELLVAVTNDGREGYREVSDGVTVDLNDGTVNGARTTGFKFDNFVDPPYKVTFENDGPGAHQPKGYYQIGTDKQYLSEHTGPSADPYVVNRGVVVPAFDITYERPELRYNTTIHVQEGGSP